MSAHLQRDTQALRSPTNKVLVVDDDASILGVIAEVLEDEGYIVYTASSGEEAVELLGENVFALVMSDIRLPGMNGVAVLEHVKQVSERTNVIMITSHASLETSIDSIKKGAYDYLLKPFEDLSLISNAAKRAVDAFNFDVERSQLIRSLKLSNQELERANERLHGLAIRDGLTDLFNHRHINEILDEQIRISALEDSSMSLIFVDVDKFKEFNDEYGHHHGDIILRELAALMRENVRNKDFVARWGGEEFVVLSPNTDEADAMRLAESLRRVIAEHEFIRDSREFDLPITISAGVASTHSHKSKAALIEAADAALYEAKENGRNQVRAASEF